MEPAFCWVNRIPRRRPAAASWPSIFHRGRTRGTRCAGKADRECRREVALVEGGCPVLGVRAVVAGKEHHGVVRSCRGRRPERGACWLRAGAPTGTPHWHWRCTTRTEEVVQSLGIEPRSPASETSALSIVLRLRKRKGCWNPPTRCRGEIRRMREATPLCPRVRQLAPARARPPPRQ